MTDAKADFMLRMEQFIEARAEAAIKEMKRSRHFPARSAGQIRRRQRERAERLAPNYRLLTQERDSNA